MTTSAQVVSIPLARKTSGPAILAGYLLLYSGSLLAMHAASDFEVTEPLFALAILAGGFSGLAWLLTIGVTPLPYVVSDTKKELTTIALYGLFVVLFVTWGFGLIHKVAPQGPGDAIATLAAKLVVFVAIPTALMNTRFGYSWRKLAPASSTARHILAATGISVLLLVFQCVFGRGLRDLASAHLSGAMIGLGVPMTLVWISLEAGVVEEFFFRVLLQTRISAAIKSELGAIVLTSLAFGLMHAPGLYLRTNLTQEGLPAHPSLLMAIGYSIVITSSAGFLFGVLWARTRNFAVIVAAHGMADLLPNILPTLHSLKLI
jgi:membrane protease YdiL (CAAX protease family)